MVSASLQPCVLIYTGKEGILGYAVTLRAAGVQNRPVRGPPAPPTVWLLTDQIKLRSDNITKSPFKGLVSLHLVVLGDPEGS